MTSKLFAVAAAALLLAGRASAGPVAERSSVTGVATFKGTVPPRIKIITSVDPACAQLHPDGILSEDLLVSKSGGVQNVFVYVKRGLNGLTYPPGPAARLIQKGCQYHPHVQGVLVGQPLEIVNDDSTFHNISSMPAQNHPINFAQPVAGMKSVATFRRPEVMVPFRCSVHPWMSAYVGVMENPFFAVTDSAGAFKISGLPDGTFVLTAWHERLGTVEKTIVVKEGRTKPVNFVFGAR